MTATIVILTFNAQPWIEQLLNSVGHQQADFEFETLVIDSGSTDDTIAIVKSFPKVRLHQIPNSEFGHGKTRNLAASMAKGEFVVFLTHDAVPATKHWLTEMVRPFNISPDVVCVYGKQIPQADCCPTVKRDIITTFAGFGPDWAIHLQRQSDIITDRASNDAISFFSDVNSAVRRSLLTGDTPYRDLDYSEDYALGRDVIEAGLYKAYAPLGAVIHSHSYPLLKYFRRMYDEMRGLKQSTGQTLDTSLARHVLIIAKASLSDWRFIVRDQTYSPLSKLSWLIQAPFYQLARRVAVRLSTKDELPGWAHRWLSLESRAKAGQ